jgi:hypothetical protein
LKRNPIMGTILYSNQPPARHAYLEKYRYDGFELKYNDRQAWLPYMAQEL